MLLAIIKFTIISIETIITSALILRQVYYLKQDKDPATALLPSIKLPKSKITKDLEREVKTTKLLENG